MKGTSSLPTGSCALTIRSPHCLRFHELCPSRTDFSVSRPSWPFPSPAIYLSPLSRPLPLFAPVGHARHQICTPVLYSPFSPPSPPTTTIQPLLIALPHYCPTFMALPHRVRSGRPRAPARSPATLSPTSRITAGGRAGAAEADDGNVLSSYRKSVAPAGARKVQEMQRALLGFRGSRPNPGACPEVRRHPRGAARISGIFLARAFSASLLDPRFTLASNVQEIKRAGVAWYAIFALTKLLLAAEWTSSSQSDQSKSNTGTRIASL